jgi:hypothetical protein
MTFHDSIVDLHKLKPRVDKRGSSLLREAYGKVLEGTTDLLNQAIVTKRALQDMQEEVKELQARRNKRSRRTLRSIEGGIVDANMLAKQKADNLLKAEAALAKSYLYWMNAAKNKVTKALNQVRIKTEKLQSAKAKGLDAISI